MSSNYFSALVRQFVENKMSDTSIQIYWTLLDCLIIFWRCDRNNRRYPLQVLRILRELCCLPPTTSSPLPPYHQASPSAHSSPHSRLPFRLRCCNRLQLHILPRGDDEARYSGLTRVSTVTNEVLPTLDPSLQGPRSTKITKHLQQILSTHSGDCLENSFSKITDYPVT